MATPATPTRTTPTRTPPSPDALARAIEPLDVEQFLAEHWERQPLVVPRREEGRFDDLLSTRDVERLLTETGLRTPAFRLVKAGETIAGYTTDLSWRPSPFTGVADVRRVLAEFERGATVSVISPDGKEIAHGLTNYDSADLRRLCGVKSNRISEILGYSYGDAVIHRNNLVLLT